MVIVDAYVKLPEGKDRTYDLWSQTSIQSLLQAQVFQHHKTKSSEREHPQLDKEMGQTHLNLKWPVASAKWICPLPYWTRQEGVVCGALVKTKTAVMDVHPLEHIVRSFEPNPWCA